jgi:hypothetical protein
VRCHWRCSRYDSPGLRTLCTLLTGGVGQFYDMLHLFSLTGEPSEKHYLLMNGDLVDRGSWSIEVILTAFAFKCARVQIPLIFIFLTRVCRAVSQIHVHKSWEP